MHCLDDNKGQWHMHRQASDTRSNVSSHTLSVPVVQFVGVEAEVIQLDEVEIVQAVVPERCGGEEWEGEVDGRGEGG